MVAGYTFLTKEIDNAWLSIWMDGRTFPNFLGQVLLKKFSKDKIIILVVF
jgi:hypothetical protein